MEVVTPGGFLHVTHRFISFWYVGRSIPKQTNAKGMSACSIQDIKLRIFLTSRVTDRLSVPKI
jgi:hypothetical protein